MRFLTSLFWLVREKKSFSCAFNIRCWLRMGLLIQILKDPTTVLKCIRRYFASAVALEVLLPVLWTLTGSSYCQLICFFGLQKKLWRCARCNRSHSWNHSEFLCSFAAEVRHTFSLHLTNSLSRQKTLGCLSKHNTFSFFSPFFFFNSTLFLEAEIVWIFKHKIYWKKNSPGLTYEGTCLLLKVLNVFLKWGR